MGITKKVKSLLWPHHRFWKGFVLTPQAAPPEEAVREGALHVPGKHKLPHLSNPKPSTSQQDLCMEVIQFQKRHVFLIQKSLQITDCMDRSYFHLVLFK